MSFSIPTQLTGLLGQTAQVLGSYNILDEDTAGKVFQASEILSGQGTGVTPSIPSDVPQQSVSPVSSDAKPAQQKANMIGGLSNTTGLIIAGAVILGLIVFMKK